MGFYLRKSISVGPLRFNLSKSGVGVSAGIRGLRIGSGPRGNYVHMGRHGVYYRASLPSHQSSSPPAVGQPASASAPTPPPAAHEVLAQVESGDVTHMHDS